MKWIPGGVTAAEGFRAAGVSAGIKRSREPDLALVAAEESVCAAGIMTKNRVQAAPVQLSKERLRRGRARAVLINSGCANCLTGPPGLEDARVLSRLIARQLGVEDHDVLVASTGVIGRRLPVPKIQRMIPSLVGQLSRAHHTAAAQAILTTDLRIKEAAVEARIGGRRCRLGGMAKGAGMIAPSMATMLCVLTTDAAVDPAFLRGALRHVTEETFNRISVDGDMSTNDTVFALASGRSGVRVAAGSPAASRFIEMLRRVMGQLAFLIVKDGEGASRVAEIVVQGARNHREAQACARAVANSPLVKTMLAGADPNVGRIAASVGASPARFDPQKLDIAVGTHPVVVRGAALRLGKTLSRQLLAQPEVVIRVDLHAGRGQGRMWTCDLTEEYVRINARYSS